MKNLQELKEELNHKVRSAKDMLEKAEKENRSFDAAETEETNRLLAESDELRKQISNIEAYNAHADRIREEASKLSKSQPTKADRNQPKSDPDEAIDIEIRGARIGKTKAFANNAQGHRSAYRAGKWIMATMLGNQRARAWCNSNGVEIRALSEGNNSLGGFLVPEEFSQAIIDLRETYGVFRQNCRVTPMGRDTLVVPRRAGGLTANFVGEGVAMTPQDKSWNQVSLTAKKLGILTVVSSELDEDAVISIADDLASEMAYAFALKEDQCGFIGDGTSTYGGIVGVQTKILNAAHTAGAIDCVTAGHDTLGEVDNADLAAMMGKLPQYALMGAKFYCSSVAKSLVFDRLKAIGGGNTIQTLSGGLGDNYLGYPIVVSQVLQSSTTTINNEVMLMFGDLTKAATMGERRGITVARSDSYAFAEDQIAYRATERVDINVHDLGNTTTAGPMVALIGFTS